MAHASPLTSPPFSEETLIMLVTGWDWPTLMVTPIDIVDEHMAYHAAVAEYRSRHGGGQ